MGGKFFALFGDLTYIVGKSRDMRDADCHFLRGCCNGRDHLGFTRSTLRHFSGLFRHHVGRALKVLGAADDLPDDALQIFDEAVEEVCHFADLVFVFHLQSLGEVSLPRGYFV